MHAYIKIQRVRVLIVITCICYSMQGIAQPKNTQLLLGSWVKVGSWLYSGEEMPDEHLLKSGYLRYDFRPGGKLFRAAKATDDGIPEDYTVNNNTLKASVMRYEIKFLSADSLVLVEYGRLGPEPNSACFSFIREDAYAARLPIANSIMTIRGADTLFKQSAKVRAKFYGDEQFELFLQKRIKEFEKAQGQSKSFVATFIIGADGRIDSAAIQEGINKKFDKQFLEALAKSEEYWQPATYNGKTVPVLYTQTFHFSPDILNDFLWTFRSGVKAMNKGEFGKAIELFTSCINNNPEDEGAFINRGICYYGLGEDEKACADWKAVQSMGRQSTDALLAKYCR